MKKKLTMMGFFMEMVNILGDDLKVEDTAESINGWTIRVNIGWNVSEAKLNAYRVLLERVAETDDLYIKRWTESSYEVKSHSRWETVEIFEEF